MKQTFLILWILSLLTSCSGQNDQLPAPSGKYLTGVSYIALTDSSRKELFDNDLKSNRVLTIKVWYPADEKTHDELYLENPEILITNFGFTDIYRTLKTSSSRDVPVSSNEHSYPVLIYSHGWGEHFSQNTILMEELASHGYIVFSIAHHFECKFSAYPDGRIIILNPNSNRFNQFMKEQSNPEALAIFGKMAKTSDDDQRADIFTETNNIMPVLMKESPAYWAGDITFFLSELEKINSSDAIFKGKLDLSGIGVLGMSMGGIATNEVCISDNRVKAGVNIDGAIYGSAVNEKIKTPYLFLNSQRYLGYGNLFTSRVVNDSYSVTVRNSDHYNFTDYALFPIRNLSQIGTIDPEIPIRLMNSLTILFFDKYLMKSGNGDLELSCKKFDVEYVTNKKE
ncbi:MAG: hypothetical protein NTW82_07535 [Bacteroidia bacterium]|nr:hypothetical protein [Bacteroidia bacterium]